MLDQPQWSSETHVASSQVTWRNCPETLRFALAAVHTRGAGFRRSLIRKALNPIAAPPFEVGLDPRPVVHLAWMVEEREKLYRVVCGALVGVAVAAQLFGAPSIFVLIVFGLAALTCGIHGSRSNASLREFSKTTFNFGIANRYANQIPLQDLGNCISTPDQRVIVHKDFDPFKSLGTAYGRWSFTVDVGRPVDSPGGKAPPKPVSASEIEALIKQEISQNQFGAISARDIISVRGEDATILPMKVRTEVRFGSTLESLRRVYRTEGEEPICKQPNVFLTDGEINQIRGEYPDLARTYMLFHDIRWGGELILTHVVRTCKRGQIFYIEASRFVLSPLSADNKSIDRKTLKDDRVGSFIGSALLSPFLALLATYDLLANFAATRSIRKLTTAYFQSLKDNPIYNYGADDSIRREMMDEKFDHYSQKADLDFAVKAFDQTIVELIYRYMEERGVDVSDLRNKVMTIYNSGIMVQGGDVTAQAMAVGQGASAQSNPVAKNPLNTRAHAS